MIDEKFSVPRLPINIIVLPNADYEAYAMRAVLEAFACVVSLHQIGTPSDFLTVLGQGETAPPYLLIAGHGDEEKGYYLGSYAPFIDTSSLRGEYMPAEVFESAINLPNCTVISSACGGGVEAMGHAFVKSGKINAYIACPLSPNADDMLVFLVNFFYNILRKKLSKRDAWHRAMEVTDEPDIYEMRFFHSDGKEERYQHE